ncbi:uncharacterized protein LOC126802953 [Argentina anserina]|uniref:uncharacterized protein LOC126802953 n=1 Tax=Argentina anserina TaxID=57926 RepID=UPI00217633C3|nr:uncharacterized protein LOC126802953 [Potentilla anserina]
METLHISNFKSWKQELELCLGYSDFEHVLHEDPPAKLTTTSSKEAKDKYEKWYKHNGMALIIMKRSIFEDVNGGIHDAKLATQYFKNIEEKYQISDKAETGALINTHTGMKFDRVGRIREYILKGSEIAAKLRL